MICYWCILLIKYENRRRSQKTCHYENNQEINSKKKVQIVDEKMILSHDCSNRSKILNFYIDYKWILVDLLCLATTKIRLTS